MNSMTMSAIGMRICSGSSGLPPPVGPMLTSSLMRIRTRPLMTSRPSQMLQLLGLWRLHQARRLWRLHQARRPHLVGICQTRPMQQVMSRPGIIGATEL